MTFPLLHLWPSNKKKLAELRTKRAKKAAFTLILSYFAPDDNEFSMTLASLSGYVKAKLPGVEVHFCPILPKRDTPKATPGGFAESIKQLKPDLIAFSLMSPHWPPMDEYLHALKSQLKQLPVLVGGYQALLTSEETIAHPCVDYICVGDGEQPLVSLIENIYQNISVPIDGLWHKNQLGTIVKTEPVLSEDLANLPFPDYEIFEHNGSLRQVNLSAFGQHEQMILPAITGRGCPYRCTYCCNTPLLEQWRGKARFIRKYDPQKLVDELARLRDRYEVDFFEFWDELFMANMKFAREFIDLYGRQVNTAFSINARVEKMDADFCQQAADAGCQTMWFGLETGSQRYRDKWLGRKMSNEQIIHAAENARLAGIHRHTFNMIGMPFEKQEDMWQTLKINKSIEPEFFWFFSYMPLRGTPLYNVTKDANLLLPDGGDDYLSGQREDEGPEDFHLNIKEHPDAATQNEFREVCVKMQAFQQKNNRLSFSDRRAGKAIAGMPS